MSSASESAVSVITQLEKTIQQLPWDERSGYIEKAFHLCIDENNLDYAARVLELYAHGFVNENVISMSNVYIRRRMDSGWQITATFDPRRTPNEHEIVICYGNYPHTVESLPTTTNHVYRHPIYFSDLQDTHTCVENNKAWDPVDCIYILTTETRLDRYFNILLELCRVSAPLHRIYKYCGGFTEYTGNKSQDKYICASQNHADVATDFLTKGHNYCLVLEDDFSFLSDPELVFTSLNTFFERNYDFHVCFLSYSKIGLVEPYDDLVSYNKQPCTTSSGYLLQKYSAPEVRDCFLEGIEMMKKGHSTCIYCCDRYWYTKFSNINKLLCFKRKLGYQYVTHSDIVNQSNINFD